MKIDFRGNFFQSDGKNLSKAEIIGDYFKSEFEFSLAFSIIL